jgi:hypothetical protein
MLTFLSIAKVLADELLSTGQCHGLDPLERSGTSGSVVPEAGEIA